MESGLTPREAGQLLRDVEYLKGCCSEVEKKMDSAQTRSTATLTTVIILLITTVINLVLYYAK